MRCAASLAPATANSPASSAASSPTSTRERRCPTRSVAAPHAIGLPALTRTVDQLVGALERGTPLVEVFRAQAHDSRDDAKRQLIEAAGRKEVAMLVPLVFLILPVTIAFAFFPGLLVLGSGSDQNRSCLPGFVTTGRSLTMVWQVEDDLWISRSVEFAGPERVTTTAADLYEEVAARDSGGFEGIQAYQQRYGGAPEKPLLDFDFPHDVLSRAEFEEIWEAARATLEVGEPHASFWTPNP